MPSSLHQVIRIDFPSNTATSGVFRLAAFPIRCSSDRKQTELSSWRFFTRDAIRPSGRHAHNSALAVIFQSVPLLMRLSR